MLDGDFARAWDVSDRVMRQRRGQSCESCAEMLADRHAVDLVHINGYAQAALAGGRPAVVVAHSDVLSWWRAVHGEPAPAAWREYRRQIVCGLRAAARVVVPTRAVLDDLRREYGLPLRNAAIIANGVDIGAFSPQPKRPAIMAGGRIWDAAKNLRLLDDIAPLLAWPVEIAGETVHPEHGAAELRHARALGVLDAAEMRQRLAEAAIYAAPARYEPFALGIPDKDAYLELAGLSRAVAECLRREHPAAVLTHAYEGGHPDHDAAAFAVQMACRSVAAADRPAIVEMPFYHAVDGRMVTGGFLPAQSEEVAIRLGGADLRRKRRMVDCFYTQREILSCCTLDIERFRPAPAYEFRAPQAIASIATSELVSAARLGANRQRAAFSSRRLRAHPTGPRNRARGPSRGWIRHSK